MKYIADSKLDVNDFTIHLYSLELCITLLFLSFLCRALIFHISYLRLQELF